MGRMKRWAGKLAIMAVGLGAVGLSVLTALRVEGPGFIANTDFRALYTGARMAAAGEKDNFYDLKTQYGWQSGIFSDLKKYEDLMPFVNPPVVAAGVVWLGRFGPVTGYLIWAGINLVLIGGLYFLTDDEFSRKLGKRWGMGGRVGWGGLCFGFFPLWIRLIQGQWSVVLT